MSITPLACCTSEGPISSGREHPETTALDHGRAAHADSWLPRVAITTSLQPSRAALPAKQRPAAMPTHRYLSGKTCESRECADMQPRNDGHVGVARPAAAPLREQHHRQPLLQRNAQQAVGLGVVAHALRAGQHGGVVGHDHGARAFGSEHCPVDRADAGHHAVGWRVRDQVLRAAPAALRRHSQRAIFEERALVAQIGDVLPRGSHAQRVALGDRVRARGIEEEALALAQPGQISPLGVDGRRFGPGRRPR